MCRVTSHQSRMIRIVGETYIHMAKPFVTALVLLGIFSQSSKTALEEFAQLRNEVDLARASGDVRARLHAILKIEKLLNEHRMLSKRLPKPMPRLATRTMPSIF